MPADIERWLPVVGFPGYEVSALGRIRSLNNTRGRPLPTPKYLVGSIQSPGYPIVNLRRDQRTHKRFVHRLVLEAFVGACPAGWVACHHPDNDRTNCRLSNLRWASYVANENDKRLQGIYPEGERHYCARITEADVREIRRLCAAGVLQRDVAKQFGIRQGHVSRICAGKAWRSVSDAPQAVTDS